MNIGRSPAEQYVEISSKTRLFAAPDGRSWLIDVGASSVIALPVSTIARARSSVAASLLEGAVAAGLTGIKQSPAATSYTLPRYIRWLAGNYVFAGQTPALFRRGAERFEAFGRPDLARFARQKAEEEQGHANLAYRDLQGLGLPAAEIIRVVQPPSAEIFIDRFRSYVESDQPVALFGFSYCLERMAACRDQAFIHKVKAICPPAARAYRFLKVHSGVGADSAHVDEQLSFFESLTITDLAPVVCAAYETADLLAQQPSIDEDSSDEVTERKLQQKGATLSRTDIQSDEKKNDNLKPAD
jgi:hypothetical protein